MISRTKGHTENSPARLLSTKSVALHGIRLAARGLGPDFGQQMALGSHSRQVSVASNRAVGSQVDEFGGSILPGLRAKREMDRQAWPSVV